MGEGRGVRDGRKKGGEGRGWEKGSEGKGWEKGSEGKGWEKGLRKGRGKGVGGERM